MTITDTIELRSVALDAAIKINGQRQYPETASEVIAAARLIADFIAGTNDAEIIRAAREFADKVKG